MSNKKSFISAILAPNAGDYYSGIDAPVLYWVQDNVTRDVRRPLATPFGSKAYCNATGDEIRSSCRTKWGNNEAMYDACVANSSASTSSNKETEADGDDGDGGGEMSDTTMQLINLTAQGTNLLMSKLSERKRNAYRVALRAHCGKKPLFGRRKRDAYFRCMANFNKAYADKLKIRGVPNVPPSREVKKDWFENPVVIVGGIAGLALVGFLAYKTMGAKKA